MDIQYRESETGCAGRPAGRTAECNPLAEVTATCLRKLHLAAQHNAAAAAALVALTIVG